MISACSAHAATYYVASNGSDDAPGTLEDHPFQRIQKAVDVVAPGDSILLEPGIYFGTVLMRTAGTADLPITIRAAKMEGEVVMSGADPDIRSKAREWKLVDPELQLYAIPYPERPARVLYDRVDLLPYPSLANLKTFHFNNGMPGTRHGFTFEGGNLYVRLHPDGTYGSPDPGQHIMAVSPSGSGGSGSATIIQAARDAILSIRTDKPSHVVLDGITFETPGISAIYAPDGDVTVRNCRFFGCRSAVSGRATLQDTTKNTNRVIVENCEFTQFPAFEDMVEVINLHKDDPWRGDRKLLYQRIFWWQRKGDQKGGGIGYENTYETGMATNIGTDWIIRRNNIHDVFEAFSTWGTDHSKNLQIYDNHIERLLDNAVETENRAVELSFYHNEVIDVFEPFSWQPLRATPWPGPIWIYSNLVVTTPAVQGLWKSAGQTPGVWKIGASENNWKRKDIKMNPNEPVRASGEGFFAYNNTVYCPGSEAITRIQSPTRTFENFHFFNNVVLVDDLSATATDHLLNIDFCSNIAVFLAPDSKDRAAIFAGTGGIAVEGTGETLWKSPVNSNFELTENSPAKGVRKEGDPSHPLVDAGAIPTGSSWMLPPVGPQPETSKNLTPKP